MSEFGGSPGDEVQTAAATAARRRKPRPSRGKGLRATTGCVVCRARHMKCDEERPICGACAKSKRECVYGDGSTRNAPRKRKDGDKAEEAAFPETPAAIPSTFPDNPRVHRGSDAASQRTDSYVDDNALAAFRPRKVSKPGDGEDTALNMFIPHAVSIQTEDNTATSPASTHSSNAAYSADVAPLRWFGLLAGDAHNAEWGFQPITINRPTTQSSQPALGNTSLPARGQHFIHRAGLGIGQDSYSYIAPESVSLSDFEKHLFAHFVKTISLWIDLTDPKCHFSVMVPHLALRNQGVMKAILALCARHLSIKQTGPGPVPDRTLAVQYYYETLQYLQYAMKNEAYLRSEELLATVLLMSTYEMIDGEGKAWERHLKGVFWIQRSQDINGESGGLKQAIWWAWLRQDVWAAFRERRKVLSFFRPTKPYYAMDHWDIAARCVYLLAQCVNHSSDQEVLAGRTDMVMRLAKAEELSTKLDDWLSHLTSHFTPLPCVDSDKEDYPFKPIWVHPPVFGVALQMYHFAKMLLAKCTSAADGIEQHWVRDLELNESIDTICGIAVATEDDAAKVVSTQCIYGAGLQTRDPEKRKAILEMIVSHRDRTGWPVHDLRIDLEAEWSKIDRPP